MTGKDFVVIAEAINELTFVHEQSGTEGSTRRYVAEVFASALAASNPRFDSGRFVSACCKS